MYSVGYKWRQVAFVLSGFVCSAQGALFVCGIVGHPFIHHYYLGEVYVYTWIMSMSTLRLSLCIVQLDDGGPNIWVFCWALCLNNSTRDG